MSHLRHDLRNHFATNSGAADGVALATRGCGRQRPLRRRWLPADQLDEGCDDAVELVVQAGVLLDVAADDGNFQTRESFAGRAESAVVTRGAIFSAAVHALGAGVQGAAFARARGGLREGAREVAREVAREARAVRRGVSNPKGCKWCELAQSASQIELTRPWREQIAIRDREEARYRLGEAERRSRLRRHGREAFQRGTEGN